MSNHSKPSDFLQTPYVEIVAQRVSHELDARGLDCPMPLLKAKQALHHLQDGDKLRVLATDAGSVRDFHSFAALSKHSINAFSEHNGEYCYIILKNDQ